MRAATAGTTALCLWLTACSSNVDEKKAAAPPSPERMAYINEFKKIDKAGKGLITLSDASAYYTDLFKQLDKRHDGLLDEQELQAALPLMNAQSGKELLTRLDRNGDNRISLQEFLVAENWLFQLARSGEYLSSQDVEKNAPASVAPGRVKENPEDMKGDVATGRKF